MCVYLYVWLCVCVCLNACMPQGGEVGGVGGFDLEPFQLLMHYRQIGPQIGLFAVD